MFYTISQCLPNHSSNLFSPPCCLHAVALLADGVVSVILLGGGLLVLHNILVLPLVPTAWVIPVTWSAIAIGGFGTTIIGLNIIIYSWQFVTRLFKCCEPPAPPFRIDGSNVNYPQHTPVRRKGWSYTQKHHE